MLIVRLKHAIDEYRHRTGRRMSVAELARRLRMSESALWGIARPGRSTTLHTIEKIARALDTNALELLEEVADAPEAKGATGPHAPPRPRRLREKTRRKRDRPARYSGFYTPVAPPAAPPGPH